MSPATLKEDCVGSILLQTHAPSDTAVISLRIDLASGDLVVPAYLYVLMDPKPLELLIAASA